MTKDCLPFFLHKRFGLNAFKSLVMSWKSLDVNEQTHIIVIQIGMFEKCRDNDSMGGRGAFRLPLTQTESPMKDTVARNLRINTSTGYECNQIFN